MSRLDSLTLKTCQAYAFTISFSYTEQILTECKGAARLGSLLQAQLLLSHQWHAPGIRFPRHVWGALLPELDSALEPGASPH